MNTVFKNILCFVVGFIFSKNAISQNDVSILSNKFNFHLKSNRDSTTLFLNKFHNSTKLNKVYEDDYINLRGLYAYFWENNIQKANVLFDSSIVLSKLNKDTLTYYQALKNKAFIERDLGNTSISFNLLIQCANYSKLKNNLKELSIIYNNMALTMLYAKNEAEAEKYFKLALPLLETYSSKEKLASAQIGLATTLFTLKKNEEGLFFLNKAKQLAFEIKDSLTIADCFKEEGTCYFDNDNYPKAIQCFETAKNIYLKYNVAEPLGVVYINLYSCYADINKMDRAKICIDSGLYYVNVLKQIDLLVTAKWYEADYYKRIGNYKKAFELFETYTNQKDSIFGMENTDNINNLNIQYKTLEKDNQILKNENELNENQKVIQNQIIKLYFGIGLLVTLLGVLFTALYFIRKQRKLNAELNNLNSFKNKIFTIISHDLRSPINSIVSHSKETSTQNKASNVLHILDNLLNWSYPQLSKNQLKTTTIILNEILEEVIQQTFYLIENKHQKFEIKIDENFTFLGDYDTTLIILRNLVTNASKYSNEFDTIFFTQTDKTLIIKNKLSSNPDKGLGIGIKLCQDLALQNNYKLLVDFNSDVANVKLEL